MSTIAIVGAGNGLGRAVARRFAREGFAVALVARNRSRLDELAADLIAQGHTAEGFAADARDPDSLRSALDQASEKLGLISVLQYSPVPAREFMKPVLETDVDDLVGPVELSIYGPVLAAQYVIPAMRAAGTGTIMFVNGASAVRPRGAVAGTSIAFAGESAYAQLLHDALAPEGIHVGQLIIPRGIGSGPDHEPDAIAETIWHIHTGRGAFRTYLAPLDD